MVLATHAVVGTIIATSITKDPVLAFSIAFATHFALDHIPHWDYSLYSLKEDKENHFNHDMVLGKTFLIDLCRIGADALLGTIVSFVIAIFIFKSSTPLVVLASVAGAIMPDPLQFLFWKTKSKILLPLQKFHIWIHGRSLKIHYVPGVLLQAFVILVVLGAVLMIKR